MFVFFVFFIPAMRLLLPKDSQMTSWLCLPSPPAVRPPQTHQIRSRVRVFLPRDRPTELVNRPSLAPSHGRRQLPVLPIFIYADAGPVSSPLISR